MDCMPLVGRIELGGEPGPPQKDEDPLLPLGAPNLMAEADLKDRTSALAVQGLMAILATAKMFSFKPSCSKHCV